MCLLVILLSMGLYSIIGAASWAAASRPSAAIMTKRGGTFGMKRSGATMTGALLALVSGDQDGSQRDFIGASKKFREALEKEKARRQAAPKRKAYLQADRIVQVLWRKSPGIFTNDPSVRRGLALAAGRLGQETSQLLDSVDQLAMAHETSLGAGNRDPPST